MVSSIRSWIESITGLTNSRKLSILSSMSEAEFREDVLVPLLRKMGYSNVRERHGPAEYGKDITFLAETPLGRSNYAVVAKAGDISGAASGKQNLSSVMVQVDQAFEMPFSDAESQSKETVSHVIVWASGNISNSAETQIVDAVSEKYRNASFKDGQATVELLDKHIPTFFAVGDAYISDYYSNAKEYYARSEELHTLGASSDKYRLPTIFVPPILRPYVPRLKDSALDKRAYSFKDLLEMDHNLLIAGQMGAGKSSLLRRLLIAIIDQNEAEGSAAPLPVILRAKDTGFSSSEKLVAAIEAEILRFSPHSEPQTVLSEGASGAILLIDGVDELKEEDRILDALEVISDFAETHPGSRLLVAMRTMDILKQPEVLSDFSMLELEELTRSQITKFVQNWFGKDDPIGIQVIQFLQTPEALHGLPSTPLTIAIVTILYANGTRELPANLTELFSKYVELALGRWDESKGVSQQIEWRIKDFLLRGLAWDMHGRRELIISPEELDEIVEKIGQDRGLDIDPALFRDEIDERSELLVLDNDGLYEFKHRAFQDFFVAEEMVSRAGLVDLVVEKFLDSWWEKAVFFACGLRPDSVDLLSTIMDDVVPSGKTAFTYAINLGMATQASYLTPRETKKRAVDQVLDALLDAWESIAEEFDSVQDMPDLPPFLSPHLLMLAVFTGTAHHALGSITLVPVQKKIAVEYLSQDLTDIEPGARRILEWKAFFLGVGLAASGEVEAFSELIQSNLVRDPALHYVAMISVFTLKDQPLVSSQSKKTLRKIEKRLRRSILDNRDYLKSLGGSDPFPLLESDGDS